MIFHSYVKLPEGTIWENDVDQTIGAMIWQDWDG